MQTTRKSNNEKCEGRKRAGARITDKACGKTDLKDSMIGMYDYRVRKMCVSGIANMMLLACQMGAMQD